MPYPGQSSDEYIAQVAAHDETVARFQAAPPVYPDPDYDTDESWQRKKQQDAADNRPAEPYIDPAE